MNYTGEHLWPGFIGHALVIIAFVSSILAALSYTFGTNSKSENLAESWKNIGRVSFSIHGLSIFGVIGLLFFIMIKRYYEYEYVWGHTSDELPFQYIFSAFWEGQEGSFLLWMFWNVVLGIVLLFTAKNWEMPVLASLAVVQIFLTSMLLGFYVGDADSRIGSNPFALLREVHEAPIFNTPNYLQTVKGTGLNPLLQNYWMTIHPPTLFLGFASTVVPFAFAIAGLWKREHQAWIKPALTWALFSGMILGTGILMGGAWAYEALSFGGYWAWDPVENASLVPWLIMIAGIHTAMTSKNTGHSTKSTYLFFLFSFVLIVYSTFLTRSGVLGDTSVHAFTEMGLEWQLVIFLIVLIAWPLWLYFSRVKGIKGPVKEESSYSREFWMFVGALVLLFSSVLITFTTSIPVWNKIADGVSWLFGGGDIRNMAPPEDEVAHHNRFQLWIGVLIGLLSGVSILLRYKVKDITKSYSSFLIRHLGIAAGLSTLITIPAMLLSGIYAWQYCLLVWTGLFSVCTNLDYIINVLRGKIAVAAAPVSHIGFGLLMLGVVYSGVLKRPISTGFNSIEVSDLNPQSNKNVLVAKGDNIAIGEGYSVQYTKDWPSGNMQFYELKFTKKNASGKIIDEFTTTPNVIRDSLPSGEFKFRAANPNTRHYLHKDVFTLAVPNWAFDDPEKKKEKKEKWESYKMAQGDTVYTRRYYVIFTHIDNNIPSNSNYSYKEGDIPVTAVLEVHQLNSDKMWLAKPFFYIRESVTNNIPFELKEVGLNFRLPQIIAEEKKLLIEIQDTNPEGEYVVVQALIFPGINWVWLGSIMMLLGLLMGMFQKLSGKKQVPDVNAPAEENI
jgi:cytochrome c-type biogenesis protein CcmF